MKSLQDQERLQIIKKWIDIINEYFESTIKVNLSNINNYVIDLAILENDEPYFIEINPFGKEYPSGSSLFHWIIDEDILYGKSDKIYFRYTVNK